jgi:hypothetical protein
MPWAKGCKPGDGKRKDKKWPKLPPPVKVPPPRNICQINITITLPKP